MHDLVASLLESTGLFNLLVAQMFYLAQPLVSGTPSYERMGMIAVMLEDKDQLQAFIRTLRGEASI
jgi:hypothetical protein